ncbi:DNA repair ATPase [Faucicola boevrei]|uniref:DNA repair ATPase n=1 Tax=Faucicola boevrei TaxID=346665 RepID=UPI00037DF462|nr:DNA repair ATPase [Moraxella boevrei]
MPNLTTTATEPTLTGNTYDLIKQRLTEQGNRLTQQTQALDHARLAEFGNTQMQVLARTRIRTENNCIARDMVQVGDFLLFGYNVFMGLKQETHVDDVLSLYRLVKNDISQPDTSENPDDYHLELVNLAESFLNQPNFIQDFNELYRYYKNTQLLQLIVKDGKLLIAFQIGERISDLRVFRFSLSPDGHDVQYMDNRGERDIALPPPYDFDWTATTRENVIHGKHPHINILDTLFVETLNGDLTIKIENNTETGLGIFSEAVQDKTQALTDANIFYAQVGSLILLKILPYRENDYRYLVYNTLTETVTRLDAIGQSCVQLPENHGIVFPNGYYLQSGEYKLFENKNHMQNQSLDLKFKRRIASPNGEDVLYLFYDVVQGITGLFAYNLIKKQLQNPIFCHGYALSASGLLVLFNAQNEPTRIHPMQIWQTPYASDEFVSNQPENTSFYGKIGNKELVRGISDIYGVTRLIGNQQVSQKLYEELSATASRLFERYYWLAEPELAELNATLHEVINTSELVIDEFAKVQAIQKQTQQAVNDAEQQQNEIFRQIRLASFQTANDFVSLLAKLRQQQGHLVSLETLRYLDNDKLTQLKQQVSEQEKTLAEQTVTFLSSDNALIDYEVLLNDIQASLEQANSNHELSPMLTTIEQTANGLDLLTELLGTLDVADATVRTQIIDDISVIYAKLNQSKAKLNHKRKSLGSAENIAQFSAQFKLFNQAVANALSIATTPEKSDEQLARLLVQLEELEGQFSDDVGLSEQFLNDILTKREEIIDNFDTHKQQLLDERNRKAQQLGDGASRMLDNIKKRTQNVGTTGINDEDALNTYFASDALVQKVRSIIKQLYELGFNVKADDTDARLKAIITDSYKALRDKSELYEAGGNVIKLGKHRFSVNTQPLDLTLLPRQLDHEKRLYLHLTGTDYYQVLLNSQLDDLQDFWEMHLASETPNVYRAEFLAYQILQSAQANSDDLTLEKLYQAFHESKDLADFANVSPLAELVKIFATPRYQDGYEKGVHDHDAVLILAKILPIYQSAGLLTFEPSVRALAQIFYDNLLKNKIKYKENQVVDDWFLPHKTHIQTWQDRAITAQQLYILLHSNTAKTLLIADVAQVISDFAHHKMADIFTPAQITQASEYLVQVLAKVDLANLAQSKITFDISKTADDVYQKLQTTLGDTQFTYLQNVLATLQDEPKSAYELANTWLTALVAKLHADNTETTTETNTETEQDFAHVIPEVIALLIVNSSTFIELCQRHISTVALDIKVENLLGEHALIVNQNLQFTLDKFLSKLHRHQQETLPKFAEYLALKSQVLQQAKQDLRLHEFVARPLSSFVRNRLINDSYLPIIGDNLAKQMGVVGDNKRTDLMGLLMLISPPGYGKTTLMEYVASRLGLTFMRINCPSLGHDVTSLDPAQAPNSTAMSELEKLNLALEMGNNVMLYLDDIQHTNPEFLQKFISLCDGTRRIDGVWQGESKTYDMRGKKFCVVMAGNPYTESGDVFKIPDMLANRADIYNLGDILGGDTGTMADVFAMSYLENALTSNPVLAPLTNRDMADVYRLIDMATGKTINTGDLTHPYSSAEMNEIVAVLQKMLKIQKVILTVNQAYIYSASQDDRYRVEPAFKLQGSYRNMNKMTEKLSPIMNDNELTQLIHDHYQGEAQLLTTGAESNLLKLAELRGTLTAEQAERWQAIKADFLRNKAMGGDDTDTGNRVVAQLVDLATGVQGVHQQLGNWITHQQQEKNNAPTTQDMFEKLHDNFNKNLQSSLQTGLQTSMETNWAKIAQLYQHQQQLTQSQNMAQQALLQNLVQNVVVAINELANNLSENLSENLSTNLAHNLANSRNTEIDIHKQNQQLAESLKQALDPIVMRMDEKLRIDMSTDESGKLLVNNLRKLTQIFGD